LRRLLLIIVIFALALPAISCGSDSDKPSTITQDASHSSAHQASPEVEAKIIADAADDLRIISAAGAGTSQMATAMTGKALEETKAQVASDLAQGKVRKRDYQNINVYLQDYTLPIAEVRAEFDDLGYYIDATTGAALDSPTSEHKKYALALVEEGARWKIKLILSPSATSTTATEGQPNQ